MTAGAGPLVGHVWEHRLRCPRHSRPGVAGAGVFPFPHHASRSPEPPAEGIQRVKYSPLGHIFQMSSFARPTVMSGSKEKTCDSPEMMRTLRYVWLLVSQSAPQLTWGMTDCCGCTIGAVDTWLIRSMMVR